MKIHGRDGERLSLDQIRAFLEGSDELRFEASDRRELYGWVGRTQVEQEYATLNRDGTGLLRRYLAKMTGTEPAQLTRLIGQYRMSGEVKARVYRRHRFARQYSEAAMALLAAVDEAHETLSGPATQKILQPESYDYSNPAFANLARLSVAHLYRLRATRAYRQR